MVLTVSVTTDAGLVVLHKQTEKRSTSNSNCQQTTESDNAVLEYSSRWALSSHNTQVPFNRGKHKVISNELPKL